jgi:hypothetical protein
MLIQFSNLFRRKKRSNKEPDQATETSARQDQTNFNQSTLNSFSSDRNRFGPRELINHSDYDLDRRVGDGRTASNQHTSSAPKVRQSPTVSIDPHHPAHTKAWGSSPSRPIASTGSTTPSRARPHTATRSLDRSRQSINFSNNDVFSQALPTPPRHQQCRKRPTSTSASPPPLPPRIPASIRQVIPSNPTSPIFNAPAIPGGFPPHRNITPTPPRHPQSCAAQRRPDSISTISASERNRQSTQTLSSSPSTTCIKDKMTQNSPPRARTQASKSQLSSPMAIMRHSPTKHSSSAPSTPVTPRKELEINKRCRGTIASGKRCSRIVNTSAPSPSKITKRNYDLLDTIDHMLRASESEGNDFGDGEGEDEALARFCAQHRNQALVERGCFIIGLDGKGKLIHSLYLRVTSVEA